MEWPHRIRYIGGHALSDWAMDEIVLIPQRFCAPFSSGMCLTRRTAMSSSEVLELIAQVRDGDEAALGELIAR